MIGALIGAGVGAVTSIWGAKEQAAQQRAQIRANRLAAKYKYSAVLDSTNIMKAAIRESSQNAIYETARAGAATGREIDREVGNAIGKVQAQSEGLASGRSKGRVMIDTIVQGNRVRQQAQSQTVSMVNKIIEAQDTKTNELNNRLLQSYQEMSAILANEGPSLGNNVGGFLSSSISGAQSGIALEPNITDWFN